MTKKTRRSPTSTDKTTAYAIDVAEGTVVAGPHVRAACRRHLRDLKEGPKRGLTWSVADAERAIGYYRDVLTVEIEVQDEYGDTVSEAVPFELHSSQAFIVGSLFGWKNRHGFRRFRRAYVEQGKGAGKSPLAAGIGHYMLTATRKLRAEIYSAATDKDQAAILFRDAVAMWERSPQLQERLRPQGQNPVWQLSMKDARGGVSFFRPISSDKKGKSGIRPYCALVDEVHEHPDNTVIEMLRAGTKGNQQALIFEITNSGFDRQSVCRQEHEYSVKVAHGEIENDAWFAYVCALDEDDDPFEDESCWIKANPLLGVSIQPEYIREQVAEAKGMPSKESLVRRLNFCQWVDAAETWIGRARWETVEANLDFSDCFDLPLYCGLDLSFSRDLTALALVFATEQGTYDCFVEFWKAKIGLREASERDRVPYDQWAKDGFLNLTEGEVIKLTPIARRLAQLNETYDLRTVAYDRYRHKELAADMAADGIEPPMMEHPQGFRRSGILRDAQGEPVLDDNGEQQENPLWMPNSVLALENAIIEGRIRVQINPLLRWNVSSAVMRHDPAGTDNRIFDKLKSLNRIDGVVALAMGIGAAERELNSRPGPSVYEERGVLAF